VDVGVRVREGVGVFVGVRVIVGVRVTVGVGVFEGVRVIVGVGVLVGVRVIVGDGVIVGVFVTVGETGVSGVGVTFPWKTNRTASAPTNRSETVAVSSCVRFVNWTNSVPLPRNMYLPMYTHPSVT
jgi:hypothetical protein